MVIEPLLSELPWRNSIFITLIGLDNSIKSIYYMTLHLSFCLFVMKKT